MKDETRDSLRYVSDASKIRERIGAPKPHVVITEQDEQQRDALFAVWPGIQQQLCRYHIVANVALQSKRKLVAKLPRPFRH